MTDQHVWKSTYRVYTDDLRAALSYARNTAAKAHPLTIPSDIQTPIVKRGKRWITVTVVGRNS